MDKCRFELLNSFDSTLQTCLGIDVQIDVECMALLIGDDFRVDVLGTHERCVRPPQHLDTFRRKNEGVNSGQL